jgi:hypothetical protein
MTTTLRLDHDLDPSGYRILGSTDGHVSIASNGIDMGTGNFQIVDGGGTLKWIKTAGWNVGSHVYLSAGASFALVSGGTPPTGYAAVRDTATIAANKIAILVFDGTMWTAAGALGTAAAGAFLRKTDVAAGTVNGSFTALDASKWLHYYGRAGGGGGGGIWRGGSSYGTNTIIGGGGAQGGFFEGWLDVSTVKALSLIYVGNGGAGGASNGSGNGVGAIGGYTTFHASSSDYGAMGGLGGSESPGFPSGDGFRFAPGGSGYEAGVADSWITTAAGACGQPGFFYGIGTTADWRFMSGSGGGSGGGLGRTTDGAGTAATGNDGGGGGGACSQASSSTPRNGGAGAPGRLRFEEFA